jgi:hypothetical protein
VLRLSPTVSRDEYRDYMRKKTVYVAVFCTVIWSALTSQVGADKPIPAPPPERFFGAWFGYDSHLANFYRFEFGAGGKGHCGKAFVWDSSTTLYAIQHWEVRGNDLSIILQEIDEPGSSIHLKNSLPIGSGIVLELEFDADRDGGKRKIELFKEDRFGAYNKSVKERIEKVRK